MEKQRVIDMHAHIYPQKIADKASQAIGDFYSLDMAYKDSTADRLKKIAAQNGVVKIVIHSVATSPKQVVSINNFVNAEALKDDIFLPFATLHPDMTSTEIKAELTRVKTLGMRGIKLHPDFQEFAIDSDRAYKLMEQMDGSLPILVHTGDRRKNYSHPFQMVKTAKDFSHLSFIGAHLGGYSEWENVGAYKDVDNVYFDCSSSLAFLEAERAAEIINMLGVDRVMYGLDFPMWDYESELEKLHKLPLSQEVIKKILFDNANKFMNLGL